MQVFAILRKKRNAMKRYIELLAAIVALLLPSVSCEELFRLTESLASV